MAANSKTFDHFKELMIDHWKEKISTPDQLKSSSTTFYQNLFKEYATNSLFLELLDFQIYITEELKDTDFNEFFKEDNHKDSNLNNFPFIFPFVEYINVTRSHQNSKNRNTSFDKKTFRNSIIKFYLNEEAKTNLINFFEQNSIFDYYFWNVTFPNIFLGFVSNDYCKEASKFICGFESNIEVFLKGVASFITHNYYFQDSFMNSYFINSQNEKDIEKSLQESLKKSIQKLNIHQIDILIKLIKSHPKEAREMFLNKIIIRSIKLWKYSPMYSPLQSSKNQDDNIDIIISHLNKKFINEENHDDNLEKFLQPVFESIESRITINSINLERVVFNKSHMLAITLLDVLLVVKFADAHNRSHYSALLDKFNKRFLLKKAFCYFYYEYNYLIPKDMEKEVKDKLIFDSNVLIKWNSYKQESIKHNKNPLEIFFDDKKSSKLAEFDPHVALAGIATSYYDWYASSETKKVLKQESRVIITIKAVIESQKSIIDTFTSKFASIRPIQHGNFVEKMKNLYQTNMYNLMLKFITTSFKINSPYDPKKPNLMLEKARNVIGENIKNELSNNFNSYFNCNNSTDNLLKLITEQKKILRNQIMGQNACIGEDRRDFDSFEQFFKFMEYFTRAYLISYYNNEKFELVQNNLKISIPNLALISEDYFVSYSSSGIFRYISHFVNDIKSDDFENTKMIQIGQVFAAIPIINKFLKQFIDSQYTNMLLILNHIENENKLTMLILGYTFKFYNSNPEERITEFVEILSTAYNELSSFNSCLPYFTELSKEFEFLNKFIPNICPEIGKSADPI